MTQVRKIVDKMFAAFGTQNVDAVLETFTDNAELIYQNREVYQFNIIYI